MNFFRNKIVAVCTAAVVVVASTAISGSAGLSKACRSVENGFFSVSEGKAPAYYVDQQISAAASLAAVGEHYEALTEPSEKLRSARKTLVEAYSKKDVSDICSACSELREQVDCFAGQAQSVSLTTADASTYSDDMATLSGTRNKLLSSNYNAKVSDFLDRVYYRFPASAFASLFDVDAPELFSE